MIVEIEKGELAAPLFDGWNETIIWSCLQGVMGHIYANDSESPTAAMALLGDFCFLAGEPDRELAAWRASWRSPDFLIVVPQEARWSRMLEEIYGERAKKVTRYAMKKEAGVFDEVRLRPMAEALPAGYTMRLIDEEIFGTCRREDWSKDLVSQFAGFPAYQANGLGVVALKNGVPVSGASSYSAYRGGIEIEIDTKTEHRRRGLATACGARLILECLARGLYPSWDAQNLWSVALAEKLGYHLDHAYEAYEIYGGL